MKDKLSSFFRIMGCVTFVVALATIVGLVISIVQGFINNVGAWPIVRDFLNILAVGTLGCGIGELFFSHACTLDEDIYCAYKAK